MFLLSDLFLMHPLVFFFNAYLVRFLNHLACKIMRNRGSIDFLLDKRSVFIMETEHIN